MTDKITPVTISECNEIQCINCTKFTRQSFTKCKLRSELKTQKWGEC